MGCERGRKKTHWPSQSYTLCHRWSEIEGRRGRKREGGSREESKGDGARDGERMDMTVLMV